jgi:hypothetical protein
MHWNLTIELIKGKRRKEGTKRETGLINCRIVPAPATISSLPNLQVE